jgi:hypothetical protein
MVSSLSETFLCSTNLTVTHGLSAESEQHDEARGAQALRPESIGSMPSFHRCIGLAITGLTRLVRVYQESIQLPGA